MNVHTYKILLDGLIQFEILHLKILQRKISIFGTELPAIKYDFIGRAEWCNIG